jgi:hypothetical protein
VTLNTSAVEQHDFCIHLNKNVTANKAKVPHLDDERGLSVL